MSSTALKAKLKLFWGVNPRVYENGSTNFLFVAKWSRPMGVRQVEGNKHLKFVHSKSNQIYSIILEFTLVWLLTCYGSNSYFWNLLDYLCEWLTFNTYVQDGRDKVVKGLVFHLGRTAVTVPSTFCIVPDVQIATGEPTMSSTCLAARQPREISQIWHLNTWSQFWNGHPISNFVCCLYHESLEIIFASLECCVSFDNVSHCMSATYWYCPIVLLYI